MNDESSIAGRPRSFQFPVRARTAVKRAVATRQSRRRSLLSPRAVKVASGSGWYHEAAIQDAERAAQELVARDYSARAPRDGTNSSDEEKGAPQGAPFQLHRPSLGTVRDVWEERLRRVVHVEFDRMRGVLEADHFRILRSM